MHELPVTESILNIVLKHASLNNAKKIVTVRLKVGRLCDLEEEWLQHYFSYLSRGTLAEGARLSIQKTPVVFVCLSCGEEYEIEGDKPIDACCPRCGSREGDMLSGREYVVTEMEVY